MESQIVTIPKECGIFSVHKREGRYWFEAAITNPAAGKIEALIWVFPEVKPETETMKHIETVWLEPLGIDLYVYLERKKLAGTII